MSHIHDLEILLIQIKRGFVTYYTPLRVELLLCIVIQSTSDSATTNSLSHELDFRQSPCNDTPINDVFFFTQKKCKT